MEVVTLLLVNARLVTQKHKLAELTKIQELTKNDSLCEVPTRHMFDSYKISVHCIQFIMQPNALE